MSDEPRKKRLTLDEAWDEISEIARNGEGAEKFRALKMVTNVDQANSILPAPLNDLEIQERLARLIRAAGPTCSMLAYRKAFPASKRPINYAAPRVTWDDMPVVEKDDLPKTLRQLYQRFPEIKRSGFPSGYPLKKGLIAQKEWCQKKSLEMILSIEQKRRDMIAQHADVADLVPTEELVRVHPEVHDIP